MTTQNNNSSDQAKAMKAIIDVAARLMEEHDLSSIVIVATMHRASNTSKMSHGCGNWYARYGSVQEWLYDADEHNRIALNENDKE